MPKEKSSRRFAILLHENSSLGMALLCREILQRGNEGDNHVRYAVDLVTAGPSPGISIRDVTLKTANSRGRYDYVIVPPMDGLNETKDWSPQTKWLRRQHDHGTTITSACLGAFLLAGAGLLAGRKATTHWKWVQHAQSRFPDVDWQPAQMICDEGSVITSGGYLAMIDLVLHLMAKTSSAARAHEVAQVLLADSIRQKQSVYAKALVPSQGKGSRFAALEAWVQGHLHEPITAREMARYSSMSLRSFHRQFSESYGLTPKKFIQLKRIEKAQELLRNGSLSLEEIVERVGVSDVVSFRRVFQRELGLSPSQFRKRIQGKT